MEQINNLLVKHLTTGETGFKWGNFSNDSNTQCDERNYIKIISDTIQKMGGKIGSFAPSQQSKDIRDVIFAGAPHPVTYECKKSKGYFILNDTIPNIDDDYYYIFINTKDKKVTIKHCSDLIGRKNVSSDCIVKEKLKILYEDTMKQIKNAVMDGHISLYDYGEIFKRTADFPNGLKSRPRPNWSIKM